MPLVDYIYNSDISDRLVELLCSIKYDSWSMYANVLKGLLWGEVYHFYSTNKDVIIEGDKLINNIFVLIGVTDITGYLPDIDLSSFWEILNWNSNKVAEIQATVSKLNPRTVSYEFIDKFIVATDSLPLHAQLSYDELTPAGFVLYWLALRNVFIPEESLNLKNMDAVTQKYVDSFLDFLVGVQAQKWNTIYNNIKNDLELLVYEYYGIIYCEVTDEEISSYFVIDIFNETKGKKNFNDRVVHDYYYMPDTWDDVIRHISDIRKSIIEVERRY